MNMYHEDIPDISQVTKNSDIIIAFIAYFSRFEYALKRAGYLKKGKLAQPDWNCYEKSIKGTFGDIKDQSFISAVEFLRDNPPATQIRLNGTLAWEETLKKGDEHLEEYILRLVKTTRNNLFHGGKFPVETMIEDFSNHERNAKLLNAGIIILRNCRLRSKDVNNYFGQ